MPAAAVAKGKISDELVANLASTDPATRQKARQDFEDMCLKASRPGAESERVDLCNEIQRLLRPETPELARVWMLRELANVGGDECVPRLTRLLSGKDTRIRELARRALQNNPSERATEALRAALAYSRDSEWTVALIDALAARRDAESTPQFTKLAQSDDGTVAAAAIAALGDVGDASAIDAMCRLHADAHNQRRPEIAAALLRTAERLNERGETAQANAVYGDLYAMPDSPTVRVAALCGLVKTQGEAALPRLLELMRGDDAELRVTAARLALSLPGTQVTHALASTCPETQSDVRAALYDGLGARGDKSALHAVQAGASDEDEFARVAAVRSLGLLGDSSTALLLARTAAKYDGETRQTARDSFTRLRGGDVDSTVIADIDSQTDAGVRVELIKALAVRRSAGAVAALAKVVADPSEPVRVAAFEALGELCASGDLPELLNLLAKIEDEETRDAAVNATVAVAKKNADESARAEPVISAMQGADSPTKASLVQVLGRLNGARALDAIRAARNDSNEVVADAAVRALADWPTAEVMDDLLAIARNGADETHAILALRGYVRLLRLPSDRTPLETYKLLESAMQLATRNDEKKIVLGALAEVGRPEALTMAESLLTDDALRDEAAVTMIKIARLLAAEDPDAAVAAIDRARGATDAKRVQQQADEAADFLKKSRGYCAAWMLAGPFSEDGKDATAVFNAAFTPEKGDSGVEWKPLAITGGENPWIFDLTKSAKGDNCCVYVRSEVWSESDRPARLELGSDDGVKAWVNGELVHANDARRPVNPGEDKVDVKLKQGWNTLMLKIVQANGGWGFCATVRAPDGEPIDGLKFRAR